MFSQIKHKSNSLVMGIFTGDPSWVVVNPEVDGWSTIFNGFPILKMDKSMVSGEDFPLNQSIELCKTWHKHGKTTGFFSIADRRSGRWRDWNWLELWIRVFFAVPLCRRGCGAAMAHESY